MKKIHKATWKTYFELGKEELKKEKYELAIVYFQKSIKYTTEKNTRALNLIYLAITNFYLKKIDDYIYYSTNLFNSKYINSPTLFWNLINFLGSKKDTKSLNDLKNFLKILEKTYFKNNSHICIKDLRKLIIEIYYMRAGVFEYLGQLRWAIFYYSKAINYVKNNKKITEIEKQNMSWIFTDRAGAYISKGFYKKAIQDINSALSIKGNNYRAFSHAGDIYKHFKNYNLAISMYGKAIDSADLEGSCLVYSLMNRGSLNIKNENIEAAIEDFERAYYLDKYCLTKFRKITKKIPDGVKTILRINSQMKI
tara:strand:- start:708 stop:1634 length:927 start_codon:yes stop_codon:yes gene_type:complete